jgi:hypothetical protein
MDFDTNYITRPKHTWEVEQEKTLNQVRNLKNPVVEELKDIKELNQQNLLELTETKRQLEISNQKLEIANQQREKEVIEAALTNGRLTIANQTISELRKERAELIPKPKTWYQKIPTAVWSGVLFIIGVLISEYIRDIINFILKWFQSA